MVNYTLIASIFALHLLALLLALDLPTLLQPMPIYVLKDLKGGSWLGYRLGYFGTILLLVAQLYTVVKRLPFK